MFEVVINETIDSLTLYLQNTQHTSSSSCWIPKGDGSHDFFDCFFFIFSLTSTRSPTIRRLGRSTGTYNGEQNKRQRNGRYSQILEKGKSIRPCRSLPLGILTQCFLPSEIYTSSCVRHLAHIYTYLSPNCPRPFTSFETFLISKRSPVRQVCFLPAFHCRLFWCCIMADAKTYLYKHNLHYA